MTADRKRATLLAGAIALAVWTTAVAQTSSHVGATSPAQSKRLPPTADMPARGEGGPIPGRIELPEAVQSTFTTPDGFTHFRLDVNSGCLFADHNYMLSIPVDPAKMHKISYLMTNYDVDYNDPQGCPGGPEVDLMNFNGKLLGILAGANNSWSINTYPLTQSQLVNGSNAIHITTDSTGTGCWCVGVGYLEVKAKIDFKVKEYTPQNNDKNRDFHAAKVDITTTFTVEYDTATLTANTYKVEYRDAAGNWQPVAGTFTQLAPEKFRFTPNADLKDGVRYRATVVSGTNGVKGKNGGKLDADVVSYFWTVPDMSVTDNFDYGSGSKCPPSMTPCPGLDLAIFNTARNKAMVPNKNAVARVYHRWKRHTEVHVDDQVKEVQVKDSLGSKGTLQQVVKRPDRYTAAEIAAAQHTVNIYHNPGTNFSYSLECTPLPQTNAVPVKFTQTRNLSSTGSSPTMKFDYYFLKDGAWSGGVPAAAKTEGRTLMTTGSQQITDQFPVIGTTYSEKGDHSIGYTMTGNTIVDSVCTVVNEVNCPYWIFFSSKKKELECAYEKLETMRGGHKFVAATVNNQLCPIATGFAMRGKVFFHQFGQGANQYTITHEVGHIYGISKANNPTPGHRNNSTGVEGFQVRTKQNRSYVENNEVSLMFTSAQPHKWVDNTDYDDLIAAGITSSFQFGPKTEAQDTVGPYLIVSGYADAATAVLSSVFLQDSPNDATDPTGTHTVELLDGSDNVLSSANVTPGVDLIVDELVPGAGPRPAGELGPPPLSPYFTVSLPWSASAQKIRVRLGATVLLTYNRTAAAPTASFTSPSEGATLTGTTAVVWSGSDADSPGLAYQLQLSEDGGATFKPLIPLTDATSYSLDSTLLASGSGRVLRVLVTDGFNTAYATRNVSVSNALAVSGVNPPDTQTGVAATTSAGATFTSDVNTATLFAGFKMVQQGDTTGLGGTITYYTGTRSFVFQPDSPLLDSTMYVVSLTGVQDVNGNSLAAPFQWSFTTGPDTTPPLVVAVSPTAGEIGTPLNPLIVAQLNEVMTASTVNGSSFQVTGPGNVAVPGVVTYNTLVDQAVFTPSSPLSPNTTYSAVLTTDAQDLAGNPLGAAASWSFTTGSDTNAIGLRLLDSYGDQPLDDDGDGLFDRLLILIDVEVKTTSYYNVNARLLDKNGHLIEWKSPGFYYLYPGAYTLGIWFTGAVIRGHNVDGPYTLDSLNFYDYNNPGNFDTRFEVYQTFPYQVSQFFSLMTFSGLPDQVVEKGTTRDNAFNLRDYTTHLTQPVSSVTYSIFINSDPSVGVTIDGSANIDINPGPSVEAESDVTIEAKDTLGNLVHSTFHVSVQAAAPKTLTPTYPAKLRPNASQDVLIDIYDQFGRLFTQPVTVDFQSTFGSMTPPSIQTSTGHATSSFSPGGAGGTAFITATSGDASGQFSIVSGYSTGDINAAGLLVDPVADGASSDGNGVFEPGETVFVRPSWTNTTPAPALLTGAASLFTGPAGPTYNLTDSAADYGSIASNATSNCATATGNCYEMSVSSVTGQSLQEGPTVARPSTHWDATFTETLTGVDPLLRTLHIGQSFTDVPKNHVFYQFVERILHNGVTTGCTGTTYCPDDNVFRLQMAVFIARSQAGGDANVPVSGSAQGNPYNCVSGGQSQFTDIAADNPFCRHVHYIFSTGVTTGCITTPPRQYCPSDNVTRGQMALFIARAVAGSDAAVPVSYGPDPTTGRSYSCNPASPNLFFTDVQTSDIFCRHTHYLWAKNVISGFPDGSFGPALLVSRGAMSKFLANGFSMKLY
ncbi:MAG TPA: Ig-like domain-containing protein [Thermoanaerobaculia bacterium]|nr:Ig-like domain-containing protein [Thermoanaerobaculia bacterium]